MSDAHDPIEDRIDEGFDRLRSDSRGLDAMDRRYLKCIANHYAGGPVGVETVAAALSEHRDALEGKLEFILVEDVKQDHFVTHGAHALDGSHRVFDLVETV